MSEIELAIDVQHLSKSFKGLKAVDDVAIRVPRGKIFGFLGPNGSGKTTTIRMICGLLTADEGEGTCVGLNIRTQSEAIRQRIGYMTQRFSFWDDLTIKENLHFVADMFGVKNVRDRVGQALETLGLDKRGNQLAGTLSGGWKQRLALVACMLHEPELLLLDEPTAGVDPRARREFWDEIHKLAARGLTVLVSTHYMDEVERCHEVIYIANGKVITEGTVSDVIQHAGLTTWVVRGPDLMKLHDALKGAPGVATIAPFGDSLHVSGTDAAILERALAAYRSGSGYVWSVAQPSMEDAFIHYMTQSEKEASR